MHQHYQKSIKTSELEDQYAIVFSLALWPEEPHEVMFFKNNLLSQKLSSTKLLEIIEIELKRVPSGSVWVDI